MNDLIIQNQCWTTQIEDSHCWFQIQKKKTKGLETKNHVFGGANYQNLF